MVRYYGYYSNVLRGKRKKADQGAIIACLIEETGVSPEKRKVWARLIQFISIKPNKKFLICFNMLTIRIEQIRRVQASCSGQKGKEFVERK